ncbi:hypothetical protein LWI29_012866 [Acer saccharum]|uniref:Uncharacterized protein n=1 Tax=Acer saccharum TaxID=4024 RepID=A0AA39W8C6_ACESA|nr:hypothetical protein LWI29_012866 [Acer saccharum]
MELISHQDMTWEKGITDEVYNNKVEVRTIEKEKKNNLDVFKRCSSLAFRKAKSDRSDLPLKSHPMKTRGSRSKFKETNNNGQVKYEKRVIWNLEDEIAKVTEKGVVLGLDLKSGSSCRRSNNTKGGQNKLGHSLRDCQDKGEEKEVTTEAQLRLNVWLRAESPPKRFNHRSDPYGRRMGGYQGGNSNYGAGQGSWRPGASWRRSGKGEGSESQAGNQSWLGGKMKSQVGMLKSIEPIKTNLGKGVTLNALRGKALSVESSAGNELKLVSGKELQPSNKPSINEGKDNSLASSENLMEVDTNADRGPTHPIRALKPIGTMETQTTKMDTASKGLGPSKPAEPSTTQILDMGQGSGPTIQEPKPTKAVEDLKVQKGGKWKRAARAKDRGILIANLGDFSKLGKRGNSEIEEVRQLEGKKAKSSGQVLENATIPIVHTESEKSEEGKLVCEKGFEQSSHEVYSNGNLDAIDSTISDEVRQGKLQPSQIDKAYPRDFMHRGRLRSLLKREDGTLYNPAISSGKQLMLHVGMLQNWYLDIPV